MLNNSLKINIVYTLIILKLNIKHYLYTYIMNFYVFIGIYVFFGFYHVL